MCEIDTLPTYEARSFMLWVAKATRAYFENPDVQERFEKWRRERELNALKINNQEKE